MPSSDLSGATSATSPTSDISNILKITPRISSKLHDESDYPAWVVEASRQLRRQKLLEVVDGTDPAPTPITSEYQDKSDKALDYLMDSVEAEPAIKISACSTAADAWKIHEGQTRTHMTVLFLNLVNLRFDDRKFIKVDKYLSSRLTLLIPHVGPNGVVECFRTVPSCKGGISMKGITLQISLAHQPCTE